MRLTHDDQMRRAGLVHAPAAIDSVRPLARAGRPRGAPLAAIAARRVRSQGAIKAFLITAAAVRKLGSRP